MNEETFTYPRSAIDLMNKKTEEKDAEIAALRVALRACENDYWFMTNLLERYSTNLEESVKDCIYRMNFRKNIFSILKPMEEIERENE
jgi:hypothetical protein